MTAPLNLPVNMDGPHGRIIDARGVTFCDLGDIYSADFNTDILNRAGYIVKAVNSHEAVVSTLTRILGLIDSEYLVAASDGSGRVGHAVAQARGALAKAKGQP